MRLISTLLLLVGLAFGESGSIEPFAAKLPYEMHYDKNTTCTIRHLKVYEHPQWVSKIALKDGRELYFSSPKSMFEFYYNRDKWMLVGVESQDDFIAISVIDYRTMQPVNAKNAYFVYGSRSISPAGDDLPAFRDKQSAQHFADQYSGKRVMHFDEVSDALIRLLNGRI